MHALPPLTSQLFRNDTPYLHIHDPVLFHLYECNSHFWDSSECTYFQRFSVKIPIYEDEGSNIQKIQNHSFSKAQMSLKYGVSSYLHLLSTYGSSKYKRRSTSPCFYMFHSESVTRPQTFAVRISSTFPTVTRHFYGLFSSPSMSGNCFQNLPEMMSS